jgi:hypothetical protein
MSQAAMKHLRPGELTIFVVGKLDALSEDVGRFGEVQVVELEEFGMPERGFGRGGLRRRPA